MKTLLGWITGKKPEPDIFRSYRIGPTIPVQQEQRLVKDFLAHWSRELVSSTADFRFELMRPNWKCVVDKISFSAFAYPGGADLNNLQKSNMFISLEAYGIRYPLISSTFAPNNNPNLSLTASFHISPLEINLPVEKGTPIYVILVNNSGVLTWITVEMQGKYLFY